MTVSHTSENSKVFFTTKYYPGYSKKHIFTRSVFLSELKCLFEEIFLESSTHIVTGDFNFRKERNDEEDAIEFNRLLNKFMVTQNVSKPTHKSSRTLVPLLTAGGSSNILQHLQIYTDDNGEVSDQYPIMADLAIEAKKIPLRIHVQTQKFTSDTMRV